jgi:Flp pilus assembly protein TadG
MANGWFGWVKRGVRIDRARGFMARLRDDRRGNTLAIMAAALIPLAGMVGGGIDLSRMYIVKTRLQHACDAGALAGRKAMGSGTWAQSSYAPRTTANRFFDANFQTDAYGSTNTTRTYTENAGTVAGTASAVLPMTLMRVLGKTTETLSVTCEAEMRLPNTDVMFVLDTTGSMADTPAGDTQSKMASLKESVKCFYEIVARLDTDANCTTGVPSGGTGTQVQVRFGFMPYSTNVNVGLLLPTNYFANSWKYQSREPEWTTSGTTTTWVLASQSSQQTNGSISLASSYCNATYATSQNYTEADVYSNNNNTKTSKSHSYTVRYYSGGTCYYTETITTKVYNKQTSSNKTFNRWHYGQITVDVSGLKSGTIWDPTFVSPTGPNGTDRTITWDGCIEERPTARATSYDPRPATAYDLDIDLVPTSGNANSLWGPALQQLIYARDATSTWNVAGAMDYADGYTTTNYLQPTDYNGYFCPVEAKKLQTWTDADAFGNYVDQLTPNGNTYHDIGLLWGARFISPTGIFASENAYTPQGGEIDRHIIFMTDGDACTSTTNYTAYGIAWLDRRQTSTSSAPTDGCTDTGTLTQQVNYRTDAICTAIKNKNITLWVIAFGNLATSTETRLQNCATSGRYFKATNAATLQATFKSIADQISALRITK